MKIGWLYILALALFSFSPNAFAQSKKPKHDDLVARISFDVEISQINVFPALDKVPQSCFSLYRDGYYQVLRLTKSGPESLQGRLSQNQLADFGRMTDQLNFESREGGMVRRGAQRFTAEIVRDGESEHYQWMNPDHERPFPISAERIIDWLQRFKNGNELSLQLRELSEHPVCPPASEKNIRPITASVR